MEEKIRKGVAEEIHLRKKGSRKSLDIDKTEENQTTNIKKLNNKEGLNKHFPKHIFRHVSNNAF